MKLLSIIASVLLLAIGSTGQSCNIWNEDAPGSNTLVDYPNTNYHINGLHWGDAWHNGFCSYQNEHDIGNPCIATLQITNTMTPGEEGDVVGNFHHVYGTADDGYSQSRPYPTQPQAAVNSAFGVVACPIQLCNVTVSLAGLITVTPNTATQLYHVPDTYDTFCYAHIMGCPIIIDTVGEGIELTDAADGVVTDMVIPSKKMRFGWTKKGSHNGFLYVDGHIFGNQLGFADGYAMLASYDKNGDGKVDKQDGPEFDKFRIWIDANHDGEVQPEELHTLASLGFASIPLAHVILKQRDANNNLIYDKGTINTKVGGTQEVIDAFLTIQ